MPNCVTESEPITVWPKARVDRKRCMRQEPDPAVLYPEVAAEGSLAAALQAAAARQGLSLAMVATQSDPFRHATIDSVAPHRRAMFVTARHSSRRPTPSRGCVGFTLSPATGRSGSRSLPTAPHPSVLLSRWTLRGEAVSTPSGNIGTAPPCSGSALPPKRSPSSWNVSRPHCWRRLTVTEKRHRPCRERPPRRAEPPLWAAGRVE